MTCWGHFRWLSWWIAGWRDCWGSSGSPASPCQAFPPRTGSPETCSAAKTLGTWPNKDVWWHYYALTYENGSRQIGPRTAGPRGPVVRGPTVRPEKVANWAPDSWAPGPSCPGPNCPPWKSGKLGPGQLGPGNILFQNHQKTNTASKIQTEMLPNVNFVPFRPNVVLKRQDTSFQLAKNHCKSHNCHPKYQYHHPNHQIPTT